MINTYIKSTDKYGRGVYAAENVLKGAWIEVCHVLILSPGDTLRVNQTDLASYTFRYTDDQDCLVLGNGELYNHDDNANVSYELRVINGETVMIFTALRDINKDEQLFTNYGQDIPVDFDMYTVNLK